MNTVALVQPVLSGQPAPTARPAPPLATLVDRTIGIRVQWASFEPVADRLQSALRSSTVRRWSLVVEQRLREGRPDWRATHAEELADFAAGLDAAVLGLAAGGACTYWTMRVWKALQERGVRAVVVASGPYLAQARRLAAAWGYTEVHGLDVPHPFHQLSLTEVESLGDRLVPELLALLAEPV